MKFQIIFYINPFQVRILLRDISGKFVWDTSVLYTPGQVRVPPPSWEGVSSSHTSQPQGSSVLSPPRHTKRHRHPEELPTFEVIHDIYLTPVKTGIQDNIYFTLIFGLVNKINTYLRLKVFVI